MDSLPDKDFKPEEVDEVIKAFGKPLPPERKKSLMAKLEREKSRFEKRQQDGSEENTRDQGRER